MDSDGIWRRLEAVRGLPRSVHALYAGGLLLGVAGVVSILIWYTGTLEPTPDQVVAAQPTVQLAPTAAPTPVVTPGPTVEPTAAAPARLIVANTGGEGAVIRAEPSTSAEIVVGVPEGTELEVIGEDVQADGRTWRHVKDESENEGYIAGELVRPAS